jgi:hypothetical protein
MHFINSDNYNSILKAATEADSTTQFLNEVDPEKATKNTMYAETIGKIINTHLNVQKEHIGYPKSVTDYINLDLAETSDLSGRQIERMKRYDGFPEDKSMNMIIEAIPSLDKFDPRSFTYSMLHNDNEIKRNLTTVPSIEVSISKLKNSPTIQQILVARLTLGISNDEHKTPFETKIYTPDIEKLKNDLYLRLSSFCVLLSTKSEYGLLDSNDESRDLMYSFLGNDGSCSKIINNLEIQHSKDFPFEQINFPLDGERQVAQQVRSNYNPFMISENLGDKSYKEFTQGWRFLFPEEIESNNNMLKESIVKARQSVQK